MEVNRINIRASSHFSYFKPGNLFVYLKAGSVFFRSVPQWELVEEVLFYSVL